MNAVHGGHANRFLVGSLSKKTSGEVPMWSDGNGWWLGRRDFCVYGLVAEVVRSACERAAEKQLALGYRIDPSLPAVRGAFGRVRETLLGAVSHAIGCTEAGGIMVSAELASQTELVLVVRFEVTDSGSGRAGVVQTFSHAARHVHCHTLHQLHLGAPCVLVGEETAATQELVVQPIGDCSPLPDPPETVLRYMLSHPVWPRPK